MSAYMLDCDTPQNMGGRAIGVVVYFTLADAERAKQYKERTAGLQYRIVPVTLTPSR